jgi:hypothetical protein
MVAMNADHIGFWTCKIPRRVPNGLQRDTRTNSPKDSVAVSKQNLDSDLFRRFPLTPMEFYVETSWVGNLIYLVLYQYKERLKHSLFIKKIEFVYVMGVCFSVSWSWNQRWDRSLVGLGLPLVVGALASPLDTLAFFKLLLVLSKVPNHQNIHDTKRKLSNTID